MALPLASFNRKLAQAPCKFFPFLRRGSQTPSSFITESDFWKDMYLGSSLACGSETEGLGSRVSSVALTEDLVLVLPLPPSGPIWNESTCSHLLVLNRATGKHLFSHKLSKLATGILPACKSFVLFPNVHPKLPELTCYKVGLWSCRICLT